MLVKEELMLVVGGGITGTIINALVRAANSALEIGRSIGTAIRRAIYGKYCSL